MKIPLFDAHCDTAYLLWQKEEGLWENTCHISLKKGESFSPYGQIFAFCSYAGSKEAEGKQPEELLWRPLNKLRAEVERNSARIAFARKKEEILHCWQEHKTAALLSVEGPELIGCDPDRLERLWEAGFVMTTLTWNRDNPLGGCHQGNGGLREQGKDFVRQAQSLGLYIDVSHLSEAAFWDLMQMTQQPILASHSNCRSLQENSRNLRDEQLAAIAETGGVVGLNLYVPFLGERANFETLRRHLEHMLRLCGEKHVCLGGDLDGCDQLPQGIDSLSDYADFYRYLQNQGYETSLLEDIFCRNLLRLF